MHKRLELSLLGTPEVRLDGQPLGGFRSSKAQALLFYLAVNAAQGEQTQGRATLAGLFWGGVDEVYARRSLNQTLTNLRQLLGDTLSSTAQTVTFVHTPECWFDVAMLTAAAQQPVNAANLSLLEQALDLYRGDFLAGFYLRDAPEFEHWVAGERTRLETIVVDQLKALAAYHLNQQALLEAMTVTRRLLRLQPWNEEAHRQLMQLLAQTGQRSASLAQYEVCRQLLAEELQVEPDETTRSLVEQIRAGTFEQMAGRQIEKGQDTHPLTPSSPHPFIPHNLSVQATPFVGRVETVTEICNLLLTEANCRLLTLVGTGGIGKTRLAVQVAETIVAEMTMLPATQAPFVEGVFFVALETINNRESVVSAIISAIAEESGFPLQSTLPLEEQLLDFLCPRAMFLLLDNFEQLVTTASLLTDILKKAPAVKLLVTSREMLGLQEEWFFPVVGLSMLPEVQVINTPLQSDGVIKPDSMIDADAVLKSDAVQLFAQCARRARLDFSLSAELSYVVQICRLVDGTPLALELAAAWLKGLTCQQVVGELTRGLDILTARHQNIAARHRSMRAVLAYSWGLLSLLEQEAAARLSIFRGGFGEAAALAISGASLLTLALLVEKSLIRLTPDRRYWMHELTRQYATEQLGPANQVYTTYSHYYATFLQTIYPQLYGPHSNQALQEIAVEMDNIRVAWQWLMQQMEQAQTNPPQPAALTIETVAQFVPALAEYYYSKGLFQEGQRIFQQASQQVRAELDRPWSLSHTLYVQLQLRMSMMTYELGQFSNTVEQIRKVLPLLETWGNQEEFALAFLMLGKATYRRGQRGEARTHLEASLAHAQAAGNLFAQATAYNNLSHVAQDEALHVECERLLRLCLALYQELQYSAGIGTTQGNLGYCFVLQGKPDEALPHFHASLAIAEEQNDPVAMLVSFRNIAQLYQQRGQHQGAISQFERSLQLARKLGLQRWVAINLNGISRSCIALQDFATAKRHLSSGLTITRTVDSLPDLLETLMHFAEIWAKEGNAVQALQMLYFVNEHPAVTIPQKEQIQTLLQALVADELPDVVEVARQWVASRTLEEMLAWLATGEDILRTASN